MTGLATQQKRSSRPGRPPGGGGQAKVPTSDELKRVEKCLSGTRTELRDRALLLLQYATGMRAGELSALDVGDVLYRGKILRESRLGREDTKYCRARTVFLESPKAIAALSAYLKTRKPDLDFEGDEPLFIGQKFSRLRESRRLSPNAVVSVFARIYERAGVIGANSHSGRRWRWRLRDPLSDGARLPKASSWGTGASLHSIALRRWRRGNRL